MSKEKKLTKSFFDEIASEYSKFAFSEKSKDVRAKIKKVIDQEIYGKKVIDLGGAGEICYEINKTSFFVSLDISYQLLRKAGKNKFMYPVCSDAEDLPFKNKVFDRAICGFLFHHLVRTNSKKSDELLRRVLSGIFAILNERGEIIIIENCLPKFFEKVENFVFPLFKSFLQVFKQPAVRFLSNLTFCELLRGAGFSEIMVRRIAEKRNWRLVSPGIILPFLKIPYRLIPTNLYVIIGKKA